MIIGVVINFRCMCSGHCHHDYFHPEWHLRIADSDALWLPGNGSSNEEGALGPRPGHCPGYSAVDPAAENTERRVLKCEGVEQSGDDSGESAIEVQFKSGVVAWREYAIHTQAHMKQLLALAHKTFGVL